MGTISINSGTKISVDEVDGDTTLQQIYEDVACEHYTDTYRIRCITAWGKLERQGWAILPVLHEIIKSKNEKLVKVAQEALKRIDPGAPTLSSTKESYSPSATSYSPTRQVKKDNFYDGKFPHTTGHSTIWRKLEKKKVVITDITTTNLSEGARVSGICQFCEKQTIFPNILRQCSETIAGPDENGNKRLYCSFCLRNEFYKQRHMNNVLVMSFRGIIGYYYYCFHSTPKTTSMIMSEIESYILLHVKFGIQNPLFRYDSESFLWFVDFSKIGNKPRQMPIRCVLETVISILASFDLYNNVRDCSPAQLYQKYEELITDFHHHRRRPNGQRILTPTLYACGIPHETALNKAIPVNLLRGFLPSHLIEKYKLRNGGCC